MKLILFVILGLGTAYAGSSQFKHHIESPPCSDGWVECFDGDMVIQIGTQNLDNLLYANNARVNFWNFAPLSDQAPFPKLLDFPETTASADDIKIKADIKKQNDPIIKPITEPSDTPVATEPSEPNPPQPSEPAVQVQPSEPAAPTVVVAPVSEPSPPNPCESAEELEDFAMVGGLKEDKVNCLNDKINASNAQTEKRKYSLLLITNAQQSNNMKQWEKYVRRHLEKFDRSDANLCMGYALHLYTKKSYSSAITWSDRALEQRQSFAAGEDYTTKVYKLYQLRTMAAKTLWVGADKKLAGVTDDTQRENILKEVEKYKGKTKNFAKEWLDFARASSKNTSQAMQVCVSAADRDFCR